MAKNIYITWHYTTHGIAYLKHILSSFYTGETKISDPIGKEKLNQEALNTAFDGPQKGILFDEVYYLTAEEKVFNRIASRRKYRVNMLKDPQVIKDKTEDIWQALIDADIHTIAEEKQLIEQKFPNRLQLYLDQIWRDIQHYPIEEQVRWFKEYSNAKKWYAERFQVKRLSVSDLRDPVDIANAVQPFMKLINKKHPKAKIIINVSLGSNETQVVWHALGESGQLSSDTHFIQSYDNKADTSLGRFKMFSIKEIPINLITTVKEQFRIFDRPKSEPMQVASLKMKAYLKQGFAILIIGERGTGKSRLVEENKRNQDFAAANCASFDDDNKAESALFGHKKGAYTGANKDHQGLFQQANGGILFLDEIHTLSKRVQEKLMKALQTDSENKLRIRPLGDDKEVIIECRVVLASNKPIAELRRLLLDDFYDRIAQHIIELPPLRESQEDLIEIWKRIWKQLRFSGPVPNEPKLLAWIKELPLYGNYRDVQKIAIYYNAYNNFGDELQKLIKAKDAFSFAKSEFEKYHSALENERFEFDETKTADEMVKEYQRHLAIWAIQRFGSAKKASKHFGDKPTGRTLYAWKNGG